jgi:hypothetical protein
VNETTSTNKNIFIWQGNWQGGAGKITLQLARYLQKHNVNVTVGVFKTDVTIPLKQLGISPPKIIPPLFQSLYASLIFRLKHANQFNNVYTHTLGVWKTKNNHLFVHDAVNLDKQLNQTKGLLHKSAYIIWKTLYLNLCLKKATIIFSATSEFKKYLRQHNIPSKKIVISGSFYNDSIFKFTKRETPTLPIKIIFVGDYNDPVKNFKYITTNFYNNKQYLVRILGGNKKYSDKNFHYSGYVDQPTIYNFLTKSDLLIMPSFSEGFPIALLEALTTGIPCLINNHVIPQELKENNNLVPFNLNDDIHKKINDITDSYPLYNTVSPTIQQFSESKILKKESDALQPYLV